MNVSIIFGWTVLFNGLLAALMIMDRAFGNDVRLSGAKTGRQE